MDARIARGNEDSRFAWRRARIEHHASIIERVASRLSAQQAAQLNRSSSRGGKVSMPPPRAGEGGEADLKTLTAPVVAVLMQDLDDEVASAQNSKLCCHSSLVK
jgi:hypothetical protein